MDYDDVFSAFSTPPAVPDDALIRLAAGSPARRLRDAIEPLAMHPVWCRRTNAALDAEGLDFLGRYVGGRAAALGDPTPGVVAAAFAMFEPGLVRGTYEAARTACPLDRLVEIRDTATTESLHEVLGTVSVGEVVDLLRAAVDAAPSVGRPLFAGLTDRPPPNDPMSTLWRTCESLREHRGDTHVAVCVAEGLDAVEMNVLTELWLGMQLGGYSATRGWSPERITEAAAGLEARGLLSDGALTSTGAALRQRIEDLTDAGEQSIVDALGDRFSTVVDQLAAWSAVCVDSGAFPPDPFKRAAG